MYKYDKDAKIELTGEQFELIMAGVVHGIEATMVRSFPEKYSYINTKTNKEVKKPTPEQLADGTVVKQVNLQETFREGVITFNERITPFMLDASTLISQIHAKNIHEGKAKKVEENAQ